MKGFLTKNRNNILVLLIILLTLGVITSETIHATAETESIVETLSSNNEVESGVAAKNLASEEDFSHSATAANLIESNGNHNISEVSEDEIRNGWVEENNETYYYKDGNLVTGWQNIDNTRFYFDDLGLLLKDTTVKIDNEVYRFDHSGKIYRGWYKDSNGVWYYYSEETGVMAKDWQKINNTRYYFIENGSMITGSYTINQQPHVFSASGSWQGSWLQNSKGKWFEETDGGYPANQWAFLGNNWYYFDVLGYMKTGWQEIKDAWYYLNSSGIMLTDWQEINGSRYYFDSNGSMLTGWQELNGVWYYLNPSGRMVTGWKKVNNTWYYFNSNGEMLTGWIEIDGLKYYLIPSGDMVTGWQKLNGTWYYFNSDGSMATGWKKVNNTWYYLNSTGAMVTGWIELDNIRYYLTDSGSMATGIYEINHKSYSFSASGALQGNWIQNNHGLWFLDTDGNYPLNKWAHLNNNWYYFDSSGYAETGWKLLNNIWYYLNSDGSMATGWKYINSKWYYFFSGGSMATGWQKINNEWYHLYSNGEMAMNTSVGKYRIDSNGVWTEYVIYIDSGHGGKDPGAKYNGLVEKTLNLNTSKLLKEELEARGYTVIMSRDTDIFVELGDRSLDANKLSADIFVSIHYNAMGGTGKANGIETFIHHREKYETKRSNFKTEDPRINESLKLADLVHTEVVNKTNMNNRGVRGQNLSVLRNTNMPAILLELGFLDNTSDANKIKADNFQKNAAAAIADGIDKYFY